MVVAISERLLAVSIGCLLIGHFGAGIRVEFLNADGFIDALEFIILECEKIHVVRCRRRRSGARKLHFSLTARVVLADARR